MNHNNSQIHLVPNGHLSIPMNQSQEFSPAMPLFAQGSPSCEVFYVERGLVKLIHQSDDGKESIVGLRSKGSLLGAASAIVHEPHTISAITVTRCYLKRIPTDMFLRLAKTDEQFCWRLHQAHSHEVCQQMNQQVALRSLSARQRFEKLLLQFLSSISQNERQTSVKIRLPLKHWEIAQLIGVTPEHLSRVLRQIMLEGAIQKKDGCMIISDIHKLYR